MVTEKMRVSDNSVIRREPDTSATPRRVREGTGEGTVQSVTNPAVPSTHCTTKVAVEADFRFHWRPGKGLGLDPFLLSGGRVNRADPYARSLHADAFSRPPGRGANR